MMLDVIAVIFIIALSFILCMKDGNYTCQMSHIVIGLSVMVFYKLAKVLKLNQTTKESFDTTSDINAFISGNVVGNVVAAPNQLQTLSTSSAHRNSCRLVLPGRFRWTSNLGLQRICRSLLLRRPPRRAT